jgi:outer membrane protein assembly factor BamD
MTQSNTFSSIQVRSLSSDLRSALTTGFAVAALFTATMGAQAQVSTAPNAANPADAATAPAAVPQSATVSNEKVSKKEAKVVASKDTRQEEKKIKKTGSLEAQDAKLPDKALYDKAQDAVKHGRYDVARLDLQTLLNTYPESQYMMRAKLAIADSWFKEGGAAALTQAEQEYKDFITFFPNSPEAAEAQMRVGDIYFRQMDKPDRDYANTTHAEEEYRLMLQQFPDSPLVPQAKQRLREVQETLASREANIAAYYASHMNWPATIARYQTVVDSYPLYSHLDDVLVGLGDSFEAEARFIRTLRLPEAGKARLEKIYDDQAADAYRKVVLEHSAAPHVEDAKDRLVGMGLPIPTPTPEQAAASVALENSRGQYTLSNRVEFFVMHKADTVPAATLGDPPLEDAKQTLAPMIVRKAINDFSASMNPAAYAARGTSLTPATAPAATAQSEAAAPASASAAPLALEDVSAASAGTGSGTSAVVTSVPATTPTAVSGGTALGVEIVQPSSGSPTPAPTSLEFPGTTPAVTAAPASDSAQPKDDNGGLKSVGPPNQTALAPVEKPAAAPDAINEVTPGSQPAAQTASADGKKAKPAFDSSDESSSKHKKKKGLSKLNPF